MEGKDDCHWVDMIIDEIGSVLSKADETILKSIHLWTELTKDMFDDQPKKNLTGQQKNVISVEQNSSENKSVAEVKERPAQHWALRFAEANEEMIQHWALCDSKTQEQGDDHYNDHDGNDDDYDIFDDEDEEEEKDDSTTVSESSENMWELNLGTSAMTSSEEDRGSSLRSKGGYELFKDISTSSQEDDEIWDGDYDYDEEEDETTVSECCEDNWEPNYFASQSPSLHHSHNEEDSGSSLRWKGGYELVKNVETFSEEDDDELGEPLFRDSFMEDYALFQDYALQGFVDVREEDIANDSEIEIVLPECDWVYVTTD